MLYIKVLYEDAELLGEFLCGLYCVGFSNIHPRLPHAWNQQLETIHLVYFSYLTMKHH